MLIELYFLNYSVDGQVSDFYFFIFFINKNLAWTTAAVDNERVIAAVPIVMDMLNLQKVNNLINNLIILRIFSFNYRICIIIIE
jgi:PhoPQ-activated pathogenicity-related protein